MIVINHTVVINFRKEAKIPAEMTVDELITRRHYLMRHGRFSDPKVHDELHAIQSELFNRR